MLNIATVEKSLTAAHRAKRAYIYVRQSSVNQVRHHQESTELQYHLVDRAVSLAGRVSGSTSSTMILASPAPPTPSDTDSRS